MSFNGPIIVNKDVRLLARQFGLFFPSGDCVNKLDSRRRILNCFNVSLIKTEFTYFVNEQTIYSGAVVVVK